MPFYYGFYRYTDPLYLYIVFASLIMMIATQVLIKSRFKKYSKVQNSRAITGCEAAKRVLENNGVYDVRIEAVTGNLTDHYDPRSKVIRLSSEVYNSTSISAVGVAAHEAGHAVQHAVGYAPIKVRIAIIPFANYGPTIGIILMLVGLFLEHFNLITIGLVLFSATFIFQVVTLPVEFNASKRAITTIKELSLLNENEITGARRVLTAAAMTYVAAMLQSLLTLLYYAIRFLGVGRRRD